MARGNPATLTNAGKGRPVGSVNKTTMTMKAAIQSVYEALQKKSGKEHGHFLQWAEDNDTEFYKLASKLIPVQLTGEDDGPIKVAINRIELVAASKKS